MWWRRGRGWSDPTGRSRLAASDRPRHRTTGRNTHWHRGGGSPYRLAVEGIEQRHVVDIEDVLEASPRGGLRSERIQLAAGIDRGQFIGVELDEIVHLVRRTKVSLPTIAIRHLFPSEVGLTVVPRSADRCSLIVPKAAQCTVSSLRITSDRSHGKLIFETGKLT
ncbi:MAG: hypothetical protein CO108_13760 [Deltaproteobacteria bacterium CG_4_9_14_3_um_filter_63_12]|nr:MAG: hypothetical protein COW42_15580 [Deltaproteobacteria bacterium CG17_big_fil_post_rev_8_21_14_2_50_63_7]PJB40976.1 MAG: hypothetical protein CO108_13760 [Deltaproteobacteria bacterium CG_4_9_14_3_um_filter_63_12]